MLCIPTHTILSGRYFFNASNLPNHACLLLEDDFVHTWCNAMTQCKRRGPSHQLLYCPFSNFVIPFIAAMSCCFGTHQTSGAFDGSLAFSILLIKQFKWLITVEVQYHIAESMCKLLPLSSVITLFLTSFAPLKSCVEHLKSFMCSKMGLTVFYLFAIFGFRPKKTVEGIAISMQDLMIRTGWLHCFHPKLVGHDYSWCISGA